MPKSWPRLIPVNRHLRIVPHFKKEEDNPAGILLPEECVMPQDRHIVATVMSTAPDCGDSFRNLGARADNKEVIVDSSMIEEIVIRGKSYFMILENYVVAIVKERSGNGVLE